jgi:electron transport complex protein RnfC
VHTLAVNGAECEPYMTCDDRLMRERSAAHCGRCEADAARDLHAPRAVIAVEDNKPEAAAQIRAACAAASDSTVSQVQVVVIPSALSGRFRQAS